jgi:hypothetical protein
MLHFLMSHPRPATTRRFPRYDRLRQALPRQVGVHRRLPGGASEHFARTPLAQSTAGRISTGSSREFVYQTALPSYTHSAQIKEQPDKSVTITGVVKRENVPDSWGMVLPIVFTFDGNQTGHATVGPRASAV